MPRPDRNGQAPARRTCWRKAKDENLAQVAERTSWRAGHLPGPARRVRRGLPARERRTPPGADRFQCGRKPVRRRWRRPSSPAAQPEGASPEPGVPGPGGAGGAPGPGTDGPPADQDTGGGPPRSRDRERHGRGQQTCWTRAGTHRPDLQRSGPVNQDRPEVHACRRPAQVHRRGPGRTPAA